MFACLILAYSLSSCGESAGQSESELDIAVWLYVISAEAGDAAASFRLGLMYALGEDVAEDSEEAMKWFRMSAEQGNADAQINLGLSYATGQGVILDNVLAHMWFDIAALKDDLVAAGNRERISTIMTPQQIAEAQQLARECLGRNLQDC